MIEVRPLTDTERAFRAKTFGRVISGKATELDTEKYRRVALLGMRPEQISKGAYLFWENLRKTSGEERFQKSRLETQRISDEAWP